MPGIIVGVDGHSQRALEWGAREAAIRHTPLTVLTVCHTMAGLGGGPLLYPVTLSGLQGARQAAQAQADGAIERLGAQRPPKVTVRAVEGVPAQELARAADSAEMLIVGFLGVGGLTRLMMGSVSSQVTRLANCPVVVIPSDPSDERG